ncbi:MAG: hypothetical protein ACXQTF_00420 [Candidatus Hecatellaceae archaeon]
MMTLRSHIDEIVTTAVSKYNVDPFKANLYRAAAKQLLGHPAKRHRWGFKAYNALSDEELKSWWVKHWTSQGLDENILNEIWNLISRFAKHVRQMKLEIGRRLRLERYSLAQLTP